MLRRWVTASAVGSSCRTVLGFGELPLADSQAVCEHQRHIRQRELRPWHPKAPDDLALVFATSSLMNFSSQGPKIIHEVGANVVPSTILSFDKRRDKLGTTHHEAGTLRLGTTANDSVANEDCRGLHQHVRVVGNGIEDDVVTKPSVVRQTASAPLVLFNGRFVERKGIHELMKAIAIVVNEVPTVRFVLAGGHRSCSGAQMESWLLTERLRPYRAQIHFTGWLTPLELAEWYRDANILVVPSWYEPFGMVILEGMLHGLAIAGSAVGGPTEILDHGRTGVLFPPRDVEALAHAILPLVRLHVIRYYSQIPRIDF